MPLVRVPTPLRPYTDDQKDVEVGADTVGGALAALVELYPSVRTHLFDEAGALRVDEATGEARQRLRLLAERREPVGDGLRVHV